MGCLIWWDYLDGSYPMQVDHDPPVGSYQSVFQITTSPNSSMFLTLFGGSYEPSPQKNHVYVYSLHSAWIEVFYGFLGDGRHGGTQWPWSIDMSRKSRVFPRAEVLHHVWRILS